MDDQNHRSMFSTTREVVGYEWLLFELHLSSDLTAFVFLLYLGRLPNFGRQPNTMGGKFPPVSTSVRPQKVSSILMKFGIQVVLDERWKKVNGHARIQGQGQEPMKVGNSTILDHFQTLSPPPFIMGADKWPRILKLGGNIWNLTGQIFEIRPRFPSRDLWT